MGTQMIRNIVPSGAKVWEKSVVPPGLESFVPFFPALPRWAKLGRPSRGLDSRAFCPTRLPDN